MNHSIIQTKKKEKEFLVVTEARVSTPSKDIVKASLTQSLPQGAH